MKKMSMKLAAVALAIVAALPLTQTMMTYNTASAANYYDIDTEAEVNDYIFQPLEDGTLSVRRVPTNQTVLDIPAEVDGVAVTEIYALAFKNAIAEEIHIPKSVTNIEMLSLYVTSNLKTIVVDEENPAYSSANGILYDKSGETLLLYPRGRTDTSFTIPEGVKMIGMYAFSHNPVLEQLTLASTTTIIDGAAFYLCTELKEIIGMEHISFLGTSVFLKDEKILRTEGDFQMVDDCVVGWTDADAAKEQTEFVVPDGTTILFDMMFNGCSNLTTVSLPDSLTAIPDYCFIDCKNLTSIRIPENVTKIGEYAFVGCHLLETVYLPAGFDVTLIPEFTFGDCPALKTIYIGDEITDWMPDTSSESFEKHRISSANVTAHTSYTASQQVITSDSDDTVIWGLHSFDGDVNLDGQFSIADVVLVQRWLSGENVELKQWENADFNQDGKLNAIDLTLMKQRLFKNGSEITNTFTYKVYTYFSDWDELEESKKDDTNLK